MTNQKANNKNYLLFDLFVMLSVAAVIYSARDSFRSFFGNFHGANGNCVNPLELEEEDTSFNALQGAMNETFQVGDMVEVYEPSIHPSYAFFAKVDQVSANCDDNKGTHYDVQVGFGHGNGYIRLKNVPASAIKSMEPMEENAKAMCDNGGALRSKLVPCTVHFPMPNGKNMLGPGQRELPLQYSVSFQKDGERAKKVMPVSRIRRIVDQAALAEGGEATARLRMTQEDSRLKTPTITPIALKEEEDATTFPIGSVIEIYSPGAMFAFPATVTGINSVTADNVAPATKYHLTHGITQASIENVDRKFIRPYQVYKKGTDAFCNVGKLRGIHMVPCTIVSHKAGDDEREIVYKVSAKMEGEATREGDERTLFLPLLRVQRIFKENSPKGRRG